MVNGGGSGGIVVNVGVVGVVGSAGVVGSVGIVGNVGVVDVVCVFGVFGVFGVGDVLTEYNFFTKKGMAAYFLFPSQLRIVGY